MWRESKAFERNHSFPESISVNLLATVFGNGRTHNIDANMCRGTVVELRSKDAQNINLPTEERQRTYGPVLLVRFYGLQQTPLCSNGSLSRLVSLAAPAAATS